ncbi:hypothetical protein B0T25DRAFT_597076 [Lasiosphaeria hispida]|uniref:Uncharacterized protein n=1 Tax=Lasiosphaeria hispida TaxID=260671 RepID=A0AAJ0HVK3_9PEZI|nr:hypothetical protein B0T25DRAFT_597076 [Lasiosphaeria hispida]
MMDEVVVVTSRFGEFTRASPGRKPQHTCQSRCCHCPDFRPAARLPSPIRCHRCPDFRPAAPHLPSPSHLLRKVSMVFRRPKTPAIPPHGPSGALAATPPPGPNKKENFSFQRKPTDEAGPDETVDSALPRPSHRRLHMLHPQPDVMPCGPKMGSPDAAHGGFGQWRWFVEESSPVTHLSTPGPFGPIARRSTAAHASTWATTSPSSAPADKNNQFSMLRHFGEIEEEDEEDAEEEVAAKAEPEAARY